ncbi:MAG: hypothetical protein NT075_01690, partial [Chloroflexi bacterium]|nr:hypothetical protein [Chloroflexota bacterium]
LDISFENRQGMGIYIAPNPQKLSIKRFVEEAAASNKYNSPKIPVVTMLEGVEIMGMPIYETNLFFGNVQILLPYRDKVYVLSLGYTIGGAISTPEEKAIFFKIIDTFRLIDAE